MLPECFQSEFVQHSVTQKENGLFSPVHAAQTPTLNYNTHLPPGLAHFAPLVSPRRAAHARSPLRPLADCRAWAGLLGAPGTVPPSDRSPGLFFGPLTSNEERAGRGGRGCGGAGTARRARGRGRRGHVTAALASARGGGALPGSRSPPPRAAAAKQLPARKQQLRAHPHQLAPGSRTCDLLLPSSPRPLPAQPRPACEAISSLARTRRKNGEGLTCAAALVGEKASSGKGVARPVTRRRNPASRPWARWTSNDLPRP